jgi:hypothetical protein
MAIENGDSIIDHGASPCRHAVGRMANDIAANLPRPLWFESSLSSVQVLFKWKCGDIEI